jgi:P27 family predicted phage terminase small subunit
MSHRADITVLRRTDSPNLKRALALEPVGARAHEPGTPVAPDHLSDAERAVFERVAETLADRNVVTPGDAEIIAQYSVIFVRWQHERELLATEGTVVSRLIRLTKDHVGEFAPTTNPRLRIVRGCEIQLAALCVQLCLTPRTRGSVAPTRKELVTSDDYIAAADRLLDLKVGSN